MKNQEIIRVSKDAYKILETLSRETERPISEIASVLIVNKDRELRIYERTLKEIEIA